MRKITLLNPLGRIALEMIANSEGLPQPTFEGNVVATEGDDISHINEITIDTVKDGGLVYFDEGAQRHFIVPEHDVEEVGEVN